MSSNEQWGVGNRKEEKAFSTVKIHDKEMNIKDYLHLYLGAKINTSLSGTILTGYWYDRIISGDNTLLS